MRLLAVWLGAGLLLSAGCAQRGPDPQDDDDATIDDDDSALDCGLPLPTPLPGPATAAGCGDGAITLAWAELPGAFVGTLGPDGALTDVTELTDRSDGSRPRLTASAGLGCLVSWSALEDDGASAWFATVGAAAEVGPPTLLGTSDWAVSIGNVVAAPDGWALAWSSVDLPMMSTYARIDGTGAIEFAVSAGGVPGPTADTGASHASVALTPDGAAFSWLDDYTLYAGLLDETGGPAGASRLVSALAPNQSAPMAWVADGLSLVHPDRVEVGGQTVDTRLRLARRDAGGLWAAAVTLVETRGVFPDLEPDGDTLLVAWQQTAEEVVPGSSVVGSTIELRRFDALGAPLGEALTLTNTPRSLSFVPDLTLTAQDALVTWGDWSQSAGYTDLVIAVPLRCL